MLRVTLAILALAISAGAGAAAQEAERQVVLTGGIAEDVVQRGETLASLSARFGAGTAALRDLNHLDPGSRLVAGQTITIDNRHLALIEPGTRLTINIAQRMLFLAEGESVRAFPIAVGVRDWPTPVGRFTVIQKSENPTWHVPVSIQDEMRRQGKAVITEMPPSPANPLGDRFIRLSLPSLGIHGTIAPDSIYHYASHGCVRMRGSDVAELFTLVEIGDPGAIKYQPVLLGVVDGRAYLEAHADIYHRSPDPLKSARAESVRLGVESAVDWDAAALVLRQVRGLAVDVTK